MIGRRELLAGMAAAGVLPATAARAAGAVAVPVTLTEWRVTVPVSFRDRGGQYNFVLDTGGAASLIEPSLARTVGMQKVGQALLGLAHRRERFDVVEISSMSVGGAFRTGAVRFAVTDLIRFGEGLRGSLDAGFLARFPSELLFDAGVWRMYDDALPVLPGYTRLNRAVRPSPPGGYSPHLLGQVLINGAPVTLVLDTGAPGSIRLTRAAAARVGLSVEGKPFVEERRDGVVRGRAIRTDRAVIGGIVLERPIVSVDVADGDEPMADGLFGLRLLRLLNLAVDPATGDLWLRRNSLAPLPDTGRYAGI